jgi:hypothetical protein
MMGKLGIASEGRPPSGGQRLFLFAVHPPAPSRPLTEEEFADFPDLLPKYASAAAPASDA